MTPATLADRTAYLTSLRDELKGLEARYVSDLERIKAEIAEVEAKREHEAAGTTEEQRALALELIEIHGDVARLDERVVLDAVEDIATGCHELRKRAFCVKDYEGFSGQRADCAYIGALIAGHRHGRTVFGVGLTASARAFIERWGKAPEGDKGETTQAAIRYLLNLKTAGAA